MYGNRNYDSRNSNGRPIINIWSTPTRTVQGIYSLGVHWTQWTKIILTQKAIMPRKEGFWRMWSLSIWLEIASSTRGLSTGQRTCSLAARMLRFKHSDLIINLGLRRLSDSELRFGARPGDTCIIPLPNPCPTNLRLRSSSEPEMQQFCECTGHHQLQSVTLRMLDATERRVEEYWHSISNT